MDFEQIIKRLDWLEKLQRENKDALAAISERLNSFETSVNAVSKQIKPLSKQVTELAPVTKRVDQYETMLTKQRNDIIKMIEENDKKHTRTEARNCKTTST